MKTDSNPGSEPGAASEKNPPNSPVTRRSFLHAVGFGSAALALAQTGRSQEKVIQGFEKAPADLSASKAWKPVSDRKIRVGLVGYGVCQFAAAFGFQDHPNVEVVAVSDLLPDRCAGLAKAARCAKTYPSLEALVTDDRIEAVFVAPAVASRSPQSPPPQPLWAAAWGPSRPASAPPGPCGGGFRPCGAAKGGVGGSR